MKENLSWNIVLIGNFLQLLQYNIYEYIGILRKCIPLFAASDIKSVYCM